MSTPKITHIIESRGAGGPEVLHWAERPMPQPAADEVLIKVAAAGVNRADILQRQGNYPPPEDAGDILGMEVSGEIAALGANIKRWKLGDKICALISGGGYAEYAIAPADQCLPVPANVPLAAAAALPECVVTVWANLFETGQLQAGQTALVHGGSSGIGTTAIQMAKAAGATIFVTAGTDEKCKACRTLGADLAINYKTEDFAEVIANATENKSVDVVLDMVAGDYVPRNLSILATGGKHVSIAVQGGKKTEIDIWHMMRKRLVITGSTLRHRARPEKARLIRAVEEKAWPWIKNQQVKPLIYKSFTLKNAAAAHKMMESGAHIGKIILEVEPPHHK